MRIFALILATTALPACDPADFGPAPQPSERPCPEGEPDCGPVGR